MHAHLSSTLFAPSLALSLPFFFVRKEYQKIWEYRKIRAWRREDVQVDRSLCAACMHPKTLLMIGWKLEDELEDEEDIR